MPSGASGHSDAVKKGASDHRRAFSGGRGAVGAANAVETQGAAVGEWRVAGGGARAGKPQDCGCHASQEKKRRESRPQTRHAGFIPFATSPIPDVVPHYESFRRYWSVFWNLAVDFAVTGRLIGRSLVGRPERDLNL